MLGKCQAQWLKEGMGSSTQVGKEGVHGWGGPSTLPEHSKGVGVGGQLGAVSDLWKVEEEQPRGW